MFTNSTVPPEHQGKSNETRDTIETVLTEMEQDGNVQSHRWTPHNPDAISGDFNQDLTFHYFGIDVTYG